MKDKETRLIYAFERMSSEEVQIGLTSYRGKKYVDLRLWYRPDGEEAFYSTRKGLAIPLEQIDELIKGLERAKKAGAGVQDDIKA